MSAPFPFGITVTVRRGVRNPRFGDITVVDHHTIDGCALAPRYSDEVTTNNTNRVIVGFTLYGPVQQGDDRVFADDEIKTPDGNRYKVQGESVTWTSPLTGRTPGFECALERIT